MTPRVPVVAALTVALSILLAGVQGHAASKYDPALRFRTLTTAHFYIYFHQGEDRLARRLAVIAEEVHGTLALRLEATVRGRTHVVLVDQDDSANGFATVFPYNAIQIAAGPPGRSSLIGNTDDWLRLVFAHEYTHILHLDRSKGFAAGLRAVFGRSPIVFPNAAQPRWQTEGLATFEETEITGRGRLAAGDFQTLLAEPQRAGRLDPLDRVNGGLVPWLGGNAPYAYGGFFFRYLKSRYGDASIARFSRVTAHGYYFLPGPAFKKTFRAPLGQVWRDFQRSPLAAPADPTSAPVEPMRLTFGGFQKGSPRFLRPGMTVATPRGPLARPALIYSVQDADGFPAVMAVEIGGADRARQLFTRYAGTNLTSDASSIIFDQLDLSRSVALKSDLYRFDLASRHVSRLTRDARLMDPDVSPDGTRLACIRLVNGARTLVVYELKALLLAGRTELPNPIFSLDELDVEYGSVRWSPDGRWLVAERWPLHRSPQLVVIDAATGRMTVLTSTASGRDTSPAWCPDSRTILFASDREGGEFRLYAAEIPPTDAEAPSPSPPVRLYRVARVSGGATSPDVSPDGTLIAFVGYTPAGYDIFALPLDRTRWTPVPVETPPGPGGQIPSEAAPSSADAGPMSAPSGYAPVRTLVPRYWLPDFRTDEGFLKAGLQTSGADVLARHLFTASAVWRIAGGTAGEPLGTRPDWSLSYVYDRWRPAFFVSASSATSFPTARLDPQGTRTVEAELRDVSIQAGARLPFYTVRHAQYWQASYAVERSTLSIATAAATHNRNSARVAWVFNNAKTYGMAISAEEGVAIGLTSEFVRQSLGADGNAQAFTAEVRAYPRLGGRHAVLALRAGAGTGTGDGSVRRIFYLGGSDSAGPLVNYGTDDLSMLRGFDPLLFAGFHTAVANVDYRRPIVRIDRGVSWLPVMAKVIHGSVFVDAGNVWWRRFSINDTKVSAGGEIALDLVAAYELPLTLTLGAAWTRNGAAAGETETTFYFRLGRAF